MKAKEYLRQLERLDVAINQKIAERSALYSRASGSGVSYEGTHVQAGGPADRVSNLAVRLATLGEEIDGEIDRYVSLKHRIINQIQGLGNPLYVAILYKRYVEGKRLELISVEMNYSYKYIRNAHGWALEAFEQKM